MNYQLKALFIGLCLLVAVQAKDKQLSGVAGSNPISVADLLANRLSGGSGSSYSYSSTSGSIPQPGPQGGVWSSGSIPAGSGWSSTTVSSSSPVQVTSVPGATTSWSSGTLPVGIPGGIATGTIPSGTIPTGVTRSETWSSTTGGQPVGNIPAGTIPLGTVPVGGSQQWTTTTTVPSQSGYQWSYTGTPVVTGGSTISGGSVSGTQVIGGTVVGGQSVVSTSSGVREGSTTHTTYTTSSGTRQIGTTAGQTVVTPGSRIEDAGHFTQTSRQAVVVGEPGRPIDFGTPGTSKPAYGITQAPPPTYVPVPVAVTPPRQETPVPVQPYVPQYQYDPYDPTAYTYQEEYDPTLAIVLGTLLPLLCLALLCFLCCYFRNRKVEVEPHVPEYSCRSVVYGKNTCYEPRCK